MTQCISHKMYNAVNGYIHHFNIDSFFLILNIFHEKSHTAGERFDS